MPRTVGRAIVDSLEAHDIDLVYCVPGESYLGFTNAMADNNRMRLIVCRHEGGWGVRHGRGRRPHARRPRALIRLTYSVCVHGFRARLFEAFRNDSQNWHSRKRAALRGAAPRYFRKTGSVDAAIVAAATEGKRR